MTSPVRLGLERLLDGGAVDLGAARLGLLANQASVDRQFRTTADVVADRYPRQLRALFSPQHGFWGEQQANMIESPHIRHPELGIPVHSLYSETRRPTAEMLSEIDVLLVDLQDVGTRVYTFVWTVLNCLLSCAEVGVEVVVLDRPNPLGGSAVEGAVLRSEYRSFVGDACIPMRHGLTLAEMSSYLNDSLRIGATLKAIPMENWRRSESWGETGLPWVPPSPNLPTPQSALPYVGQVLLEGTNLSEGRGTTTPFEIAGAPFADPFAIAERLNSRSLPGVRFRPIRFRPTFDKWAGEVCSGVAIHVTDRETYKPYRSSLELIDTFRRHYPQDFDWLPPPYEYEHELMPIDILSGDDRLRTWLDEQGELTADQVQSLCTDGVSEWAAQTQAYQLYDET